MLSAICIVAFTAFGSGEPVFVNASNLDTITAQERFGTELRFGHNSYIYVSESTQEVADKVVAQCVLGKPAKQEG